ncbi:hypothetical protein AVEN_42235-1 [Araneus ventricosus]|uniref:Uncharacterized protein n=1 Tax=Araneus ventricosus TaxID=182803 RepID=A0A4Y2AZH3_ARAVE|nr:hypothetical protein AVEN_42235-1 [Araneus ventricosus]
MGRQVPNISTTTPLGHNRSPVVKIRSLVHPSSPASPSREAAEDGCREESHPFHPPVRMRSGGGGGRGDRHLFTDGCRLRLAVEGGLRSSPLGDV